MSKRFLPGDLLEVDYEDGSEPLILDMNADVIWPDPMDSEYQKPENPHPELLTIDFESSNECFSVTINADLLPMKAALHGRWPVERAARRLEPGVKHIFLLRAWVTSLDHLEEEGDQVLWPYEMGSSWLKCLVVTLLEDDEVLVQRAKVLEKVEGGAAEDIVEAAKHLHERKVRMNVDRTFKYQNNREALRWEVRFAMP